jgi:hypothetical protein
LALVSRYIQLLHFSTVLCHAAYEVPVVHNHHDASLALLLHVVHQEHDTMQAAHSTTAHKAIHSCCCCCSAATRTFRKFQGHV